MKRITILILLQFIIWAVPANAIDTDKIIEQIERDLELRLRVGNGMMGRASTHADLWMLGSMIGDGDAPYTPNLITWRMMERVIIRTECGDCIGDGICNRGSGHGE